MTFGGCRYDGEIQAWYEDSSGKWIGHSVRCGTRSYLEGEMTQVSSETADERERREQSADKWMQHHPNLWEMTVPTTNASRGKGES